MAARLHSISLAALVALAGTAPVAQAQAEAQALPAPAARVDTRWWSSMRDATLNLLLASASQGVPGAERLQVEAAVAKEYVGARYGTLRWVAQRELSEVAQQRVALLQARGVEDDALRDARLVLENARSRAADMERVRMEHLANLAQRVPGLSAPALAALLEPALLDTRMARPQDVPQRLPGGIVRARADVAGAEAALALSARLSGEDQLRLAHYQQALAADIDPVPPGAGPRTVAVTGDELDAVLQRARSDVSAKLWQLAAAVQSAERQQAFYADADQQLQQVHAARERGAATEADELAARLDLLAAADALANAAGAANLAWVDWQVAIGGALPAPLSAQR